MCGIMGRLSVVPEEQEVLSRVARAASLAVAHRGPDDQSIWIDESSRLVLAHTRLSILDLSPLGRQPMVSDDGSAALIYNGETYNFLDIRIELERDGVKFRGHSDTEVILRLYERLRPTTDDEVSDFLRRLSGIFALAIWNARAGELLLARDGFGVKPLYWTQSGAGLAFASELKALRHLVAGTPTVDLAAVDQYLSFLWAPGTRTIWAGVQKLAPGSCLRVTRSRGPHIFDWYRPPYGGSGVESSASTSDTVKATENILRRAVHRQMVADVPVGAFLSGGIDSSAVVCFAREVNPQIQCFSIAMDGAQDAGFVDDLPYARRTASALGVDLHVVEVKASQFAADLEQMVWHMDEPVADPAALNVLYISRLARSRGIKVLLSGSGGDDLFAGYRRHVAIKHQRYWSWLPVGARGAVRNLVRRVVGAHGALGRRTRKLMAGIHLTGDDALVNYFRWADSEDLQPLYSAELLNAIGRQRPEQPMLNFLRTLPPGGGALDRMLALEQRFFLGDHNLPYTDKMSMAEGVEVRVPFLDLDLVEFAAQVPAELKQRGSGGKWILREAMKRHLPHEIVYRPKTGFGAPLGRWLREDLREWIRDVLSESALRRRGLFEPAAVVRLIEANEAGQVHAPYTILSLACIELWCNQFIESRRSDP
jgi:asparagine synthase (glutamine-hydrolysing)